MRAINPCRDDSLRVECAESSRGGGVIASGQIVNRVARKQSVLYEAVRRAGLTKKLLPLIGGNEHCERYSTGEEHQEAYQEEASGPPHLETREPYLDASVDVPQQMADDRGLLKSRKTRRRRRRRLGGLSCARCYWRFCPPPNPARSASGSFGVWLRMPCRRSPKANTWIWRRRARPVTVAREQVPQTPFASSAPAMPLPSTPRR